MKEYNTIDYYGKYWNLPTIAFDKLDGSNLRFEISQKRGFYKYGTKRTLMDRKNEFGFAIDVFLNKYERYLTKTFKDKKYRNIRSFVCFAELIGLKSEFGKHDFKNDIFDVILIDVEQHELGLIHPKQFIKDFKKIGIPDVIYEGNLNKEFVDKVKNNEFNLKEGVVCKSVIPNKKENKLYYCKIKTNEWFDRLRSENKDLYDQEIKQSKL